MTGSRSISETRSPSCSGSICSDDEKASYVEGTSLEKKAVLTPSASGSEKSDATYTKRATKITIQQSSGNISNRKLSTKSDDPAFPRPLSRLRRLRNKDGILEPNTLLASKQAQWLAWNDPVFTRRRSFEEQRLCRRVSSTSNKEQKSTVVSFKRSLQLLGLKEADLGLNCTKGKSEVKVPRGRATPTFSTQLKQRSVSLTNLRNAVQESGLPTFQAIEKMHRDILTRAVYEEWYFRKQTESRIKKELEEEIQKKHEQELEWIKLERKQRAEENFEKWRKGKAQLHKVQQNEVTIKGDKPSSYAKEKPGAEAAFEAWKAKKIKEIKAKANINKLEEEEKIKKEKEEKKTAAELAFRAWKQQVDEELKNKMKEREKEKKIEEEKKDKEIKEKRENAKSCFIKWKKDKDKEIKESLKTRRSKSKQMAEEITKRKKEREYEATQAFEEWLDQVEEREDQKVKTRKSSLKNEIPPWYPV